MELENLKKMYKRNLIAAIFFWIAAMLLCVINILIGIIIGIIALICTFACQLCWQNIKAEKHKIQVNKANTSDKAIEFVKRNANKEEIIYKQKKIKQARQQFNENEEAKIIANAIGNQIKCPICQSVNTDFMGNNRKAFSLGKATAGTILTGGIGVLAGFAGKKGKQQWHCKNCGNVWETKR
ncbi:hypothetical protein [Melissococcus plutonius]|uniref:hypothetical protein n=1 Tax=Melissococcus plutonius TaxID=33970 RepID=UPI0021E5B1E4|nr:hypothetical protein [Melissococcus plutonius]MCV2499647.1 hypothetical protein [Melissococcus plutonius]MCV2501896.1 hypothetical protein [Melissococcus plutonius]MCV2504421.1 hypothetical protein [Melissococcus plutonius]MCV2508256.1 hypothetical protein [Melissococcus plutonius]MCV2526977.1 hypothetical protein [Melissococcus plutonius]